MLGEIVPNTSSGKTSMRESDALDAIALANLPGLARKSAAAPNALLRMNSRRLIITLPGSGGMSTADRKGFASHRLRVLGIDNQLLKLLKCGKSIYSPRPANALFKHASLPEPFSAELAVSGRTRFALRPALSLFHCIG